MYCNKPDFMLAILLSNFTTKLNREDLLIMKYSKLHT